MHDSILHTLAYEIIRLIVKAFMKMFFRDVKLVGEERIPRSGPVIFVGNHSNQFIDGMMMGMNIPRLSYFLIAAKSTRRPLVGFLAKACYSIPVERPQDRAMPLSGTISVNADSKEVLGHNTTFIKSVHPGDKFAIPGTEEVSLLVETVVSDTELLLKTASPEKFSKASVMIQPKIDQSSVYEAATDALKRGDTITVFPEGGSHDRTQLLPLKPGVAIIAYNAMLAGSDEVTIVPVGLNYFRKNIFRSQCIITVGDPFNVPMELAKQYESDHRTAISELLKQVNSSMIETIIPAEDYREQNLIKLASSLLLPDNCPIPPEKYFYLGQRYARIAEAVRHEPNKIEQFLQYKEELNNYYNMLKGYGVRDTDVWKLKLGPSQAIQGMARHAVRGIGKLVLGLPTALLWLPVWWFCYKQAEKHRKLALAESQVKVKGTDVLTSYQMLTAMVFIPAMNYVYATLFVFIALNHYSFGLKLFYVILTAFVALPMIEFFSLRCLEDVPIHVNAFKNYYGSFMTSLNTWRDVERIVCHERMRLQISTRESLKKMSTSSNPVITQAVKEITDIIPWVVLDNDSKRLSRWLDEDNRVIEPHENSQILSHEEIL